MSRVFADGLGDRGSIPGRVIPKAKKMVIEAAMLNTFIRQSGEIPGMDLHPLLHLGVVAIEKGAFMLPLKKVANFTSLTAGLNSELSFFLTGCFTQSDLLFIRSWEIIYGLMPFPRSLAQNETLLVSLRIWTQGEMITATPWTSQLSSAILLRWLYYLKSREGVQRNEKKI